VVAGDSPATLCSPVRDPAQACPEAVNNRRSKTTSRIDAGRLLPPIFNLAMRYEFILFR